jgi:hypothetical protein
MEPFTSVPELSGSCKQELYGNTHPAAHRPGTVQHHLGSMFHQDWWLNAVTEGRYSAVFVKQGDCIVGRLPYLSSKWRGFTLLSMPPFTHVLGPAVDGGGGKLQTQLLQRMSIIRDLIEQLPPHDSFKQVLREADIDGLAFQDCGFQVNLQYTFDIDCRVDLDKIWNAMHSQTRRHIRRAEEQLTIGTIEDPGEFVLFYDKNLRERGRNSNLPLSVFPSLFTECRRRECGEILSASWPNGRRAAMLFLVWDDERMYYLLTTRALAAGVNGPVHLLVWTAIKRAHARGLVFDFDGVTTSGTAYFLSRFGGRPKLRMIVRRSRFIYSVIQYVERRFRTGRVDDSSRFS